MSALFDHLTEALRIDAYEDHIAGIHQHLEVIQQQEGSFFTAQDDYDNRVKATLATGIQETNVLLHDIALSLRVLSGRDK